MTRQQSFLDPLNESEDLMRVSKNSLRHFSDALAFVGNKKLGDDLARIAADLEEAMKHLEKGRSMALDHMINGANRATVNMVNAAIAGATSSDASEHQPPREV